MRPRARLAESGTVKVTTGEVLAAERRSSQSLLGGNRSNYVAALAWSRERRTGSVDPPRPAPPLEDRRADARRAAEAPPWPTSTYYRTSRCGPSRRRRPGGSVVVARARDPVLRAGAAVRGALPAAARTLSGSFAVKPLDLSQQLAAFPLEQARPVVRWRPRPPRRPRRRAALLRLGGQRCSISRSAGATTSPQPSATELPTTSPSSRWRPRPRVRAVRSSRRRSARQARRRGRRGLSLAPGEATAAARTRSPVLPSSG